MLLSVQDAGFDPKLAQKALDDFSQQDDVFSEDFSSTLTVQARQDVGAADVAARLA